MNISYKVGIKKEKDEFENDYEGDEKKACMTVEKKY